MLEANYSKPGSPTILDNYLERLTYDKNGNIQTLIRNGGLDTDGTLTVQRIDDLAYTYDTNNKNLLKKVSDITTSPQGFKDRVNTNDDFTYDANGNMIVDNNKGITAILYNHLNLPTKITFGANGTIEYIYNSVGQKVLKKVIENSVVATTDYLIGFQYKNNVLTLFPHAEGYVNFTASKNGTYKYVFNYTDHLGNVRLSYSLDSNVLKILEENHYYAFGLKHTNYNTDGLVYQVDGNDNVSLTPVTPLVGSNYKYKYNGKELQEELGLNMYDYGARSYDPSIGRWMNIDPLSEKFYPVSSYVYTVNNPVYFIDPDGMDVKEFDWGTSYTGVDAQNMFKSIVAQMGGSTNKEEEPPIDFFGAGEAKGSSFHKAQSSIKYKNGDNQFNIFGHANGDLINFTDEKGNSQSYSDPKKLIEFLESTNEAFKKAREKGEPITLTFYACNLASDEWEHNGMYFTPTYGQNFAQRLSDELGSNATVNAPDGYTIYGWENNDSKNGKAIITGFRNHKGDAGLVTYKDGKKLYKIATQNGKNNKTIYKNK